MWKLSFRQPSALALVHKLAPSRLLSRQQQSTGIRFSSSTKNAVIFDQRFTRNIGIIAHIDAGKTTTTERMLYYSGRTNRLGHVDDGNTVTDFLPLERKRGITIQSAAVSFAWPPTAANHASSNPPLSAFIHRVNLIDTPGHADFTFEVIKSLRVLDGAVCILDGVAGIEAQTEIVWSQAADYHIPRVIYINKLDRDGSSFEKAIRDIAIKLQVWPAICHIPKWSKESKVFCGIGDVIHLRALEWDRDGDGSQVRIQDLAQLTRGEPEFAAELKSARIALVELLSSQDEHLLNALIDSKECHLKVPPHAILRSLRCLTIQSLQTVVPVLAGSSLKNIGIQPLLDAILDFLPSPVENPDPSIELAGINSTLSALTSGQVQLSNPQAKNKISQKLSNRGLASFTACALAFKVVHDPRRGVLVYVRVYHGQLHRGSMLYNTTLAVAERALRLLKMHAEDAEDVDFISQGDIGVIVGLAHTRTGDTLLHCVGTTSKSPPPSSINSLKLRPIDVPPAVIFASVEPVSLSDSKLVESALEILLREDPSLHVDIDPESKQIHLSGMGELHLEIAKTRLVQDLKAKAVIGEVEIAYRESLGAHSEKCMGKIEQHSAGQVMHAECLASIQPRLDGDLEQSSDPHVEQYALQDENLLTIHHPTLAKTGRPIDPIGAALPPQLSMRTIFGAIRAGATAALARGLTYKLPLRSTHVIIHLDPQAQFFDDTTTGAIAMASRAAVRAALSSSVQAAHPVVLEPVMLVNFALRVHDLGRVAHDLKSSRGAQILSQGESDVIGLGAQPNSNHVPKISSLDLNKVYRPPDPFATGIVDTSIDHDRQRMTTIVATVPLKEMVGYLKRFRSMTEGRGGFVMKVDRYLPVREPRLGALLKQMSGSLL